MEKINPRRSRLQFEYKQLEKLKNDSHFFNFEVLGPKIPGEPPEIFRAFYTCKGIVGIDAAGRPIAGENHSLKIYLHEAFPVLQPKFEWETPIWHPNINHKTRTLCIDQVYWSPARTMYELGTLIGEMIMYKRYHYQDTSPFPLPESEEMAKWAAQAIRQRLIPPPNSKGFDIREFLKPGTRSIVIVDKKPTITIYDDNDKSDDEILR